MGFEHEFFKVQILNKNLGETDNAIFMHGHNRLKPYMKEHSYFDSQKKILKFSKYLMPSPSASSKFVLSVLKFFKHAQFFMYTQNHFGILKS